MASPDREHLADVLLAADPQDPTLDEGWTVRDLAVHLVLREAPAGAALAVALGPRLPALAERAGQLQAELAALPHEELVERFRSGPSRWSPFALPGAEAAANAVEFWVHAQDVVRARPGWEPEPLRAGQSEALWRSLRRTARLLYRRCPVGVVLVVPAGPRAVARRGEQSVVLTGRAEELLLHAFGRRGVAQVEVSGPEAAVAALAGTPLGV